MEPVARGVRRIDVETSRRKKSGQKRGPQVFLPPPLKATGPVYDQLQFRMRHNRPESRISRCAPGLPGRQAKCSRQHTRLERLSDYTGLHNVARPRRPDQRVFVGPSGKPSDVDSVVYPSELDLYCLWITSDHLKRCSPLENMIRPAKPMISLLLRSERLMGVSQYCNISMASLIDTGGFLGDLVGQLPSTSGPRPSRIVLRLLCGPSPRP